MNFKEAYEHLKEGKKIRRRSWPASIYLKRSQALILGEDDQYKCFRQECVPYNIDLSIIDSNEWMILGESKLLSFSEIIEPLMQGKNVRLNNWPDSCFLEMDKSKDVFLRRIVEFDFKPSFSCFASTDWEILE